MLEIIKNITSETLTVYSAATLGGKLFIPFFICCIYLLVDRKSEHDRARAYLLYPSLILMVIIFNPVLIHFLYKYIGVEERIVRIFWPLPIGMTCVYCLVHFLSRADKRWKKLVMVLGAAFMLLLCTEFTHSGISYSRALNVEKMPKGTKEVCDAIYELNLHEPSDAVMTENLFYWVRQYNSSIRMPYIRDAKHWYTEDGRLDLDIMGKTGSEGSCKYAVLNSDEPTVGSLEDYGFELIKTIEGQDSFYFLYRSAE
ncbi:MAG: hypothetical protein Q4E35_05885 [Eubacteriales bacterium]|nr:hypothetical protein [Eubacteriales bacterium]